VDSEDQPREGTRAEVFLGPLEVVPAPPPPDLLDLCFVKLASLLEGALPPPPPLTVNPSTCPRPTLALGYARAWELHPACLSSTFDEGPASNRRRRSSAATCAT